MPLTKSTFGRLDDRDVPLYTLENQGGLRIAVTPYGATLTSISIPSPEGRAELAAGFDSLEGYLSPVYRENAPYFGSTIGRYASRIKDGRFRLDGITYQLARNDGPNHLHGGEDAFDKQIWSVEQVTDNSISLGLISEDGAGGYPGTVEVGVSYTLTEANEIVIRYRGTTNRATPLSLTNHTYFNLSGFRERIHDHRGRIDASTFLQPDETNVPTGERTEVSGRPTDLREAVRLGDRLEQLPTGFESYYVFDSPPTGVREVARFTHPTTGRELRVHTSEPGALFYTGFFTSDQLSRANGDRFGPYHAFCFETSRFPNGPNIPDVADAMLRPGDTYGSQTVYQLLF